MFIYACTSVAESLQFCLIFFQTRLLEENNKELREHINLLDTRVNQLEGDKLVINNKLEACMK